MGIIQDLEVLQVCVARYARGDKQRAALLQPFSRHLRQRRARALRSFLKTADRSTNSGRPPRSPPAANPSQPTPLHDKLNPGHPGDPLGPFVRRARARSSTRWRASTRSCGPLAAARALQQPRPAPRREGRRGLPFPHAGADRGAAAEKPFVVLDVRGDLQALDLPALAEGWARRRRSLRATPSSAASCRRIQPSRRRGG